MKKAKFDCQLMLMGFSKRRTDIGTEVWERMPDWDIWEADDTNQYVIYDTPGQMDADNCQITMSFKKRKNVIHFINKHTEDQ